MRDMSNKSAKARMSKATDALEYIKNSIASGKTVYVTAGHRTTKVTPKAYAKWEASGKPLFKISSDGALLMASGSSYVRLTLADEMLARVTAMSRPGAKAEMARWETERTKRWDKPIIEHTANIRGNSFRIEAPEGSSSGTLYLWNDMRGFERIQSGSIDSLKRMAEQMRAKEARGVAAIERRANYARPGAKAKFAAEWMQHVSNMLRDLTNERQRVQVWIAGPTTIKVAGMWMAYNRYGKGAAIASRMAYYLTQAAGTPGKYSGQDIKDSPRKGTNTTIWTVSNVPEDAVSYLKAWGIGTSPKAFAGFTGESAVAYSRPGAKVTAGRAEDLYRQLSSGSITYANAKQWERLVTEALRLPDYTPPGGDMSLHEIAEDLGGDLMALKTHSGPVPNAKAKAEKPSDLEREDVKAGLKLMEKADKAVSDKIRTLIAEGKPQDQAVAIALDMKRRGEI